MVASFTADILVIREADGALEFDVFNSGPSNLPITPGYLIDLLSLHAAEDEAERVVGTPDPVDYRTPYTTVRVDGVSKANIASLTVAEVTSIVDSIGETISEESSEEEEPAPQERPEPKTTKQLSRSQIGADPKQEVKRG